MYTFQGFVSNGEYNSLRMNGNTRPLHILQIRSAVRAKMSRTSHKTLLDMLIPEGTEVSLYGVYTL